MLGTGVLCQHVLGKKVQKKKRNTTSHVIETMFKSTEKQIKVGLLRQ